MELEDVVSVPWTLGGSLILRQVIVVEKEDLLDFNILLFYVLGSHFGKKLFYPGVRLQFLGVMVLF